MKIPLHRGGPTSNTQPQPKPTGRPNLPESSSSKGGEGVCTRSMSTHATLLECWPPVQANPKNPNPKRSKPAGLTSRHAAQVNGGGLEILRANLPGVVPPTQHRSMLIEMNYMHILIIMDVTLSNSTLNFVEQLVYNKFKNMEKHVSQNRYYFSSAP